MQPRFFGAQDEPLFGIFHPPEGEPRDLGVVLCQPQGHEAVGSFRCFCVLAARLSQRGYPVLRFDYFGTGDSAGDCAEGDISRSIRDVDVAVDELRELQRIDRVALIGMRLGATLATLNASQRSDVEALVLWDPVIEGGAYLKGLRNRHRNWFEAQVRKNPAAAKHWRDDEILGYPLPEPLASEIEAIDLCAVDKKPAQRALLLFDEEVDKETPGEALASRRLSELGTKVGRALAKRPAVWDQAIDFDLALVPHTDIERVASWLGGEETAAGER